MYNLIDVGVLVIADMESTLKDWAKFVYVVFAFCSAFSLGGLKGIPFYFRAA